MFEIELYFQAIETSNNFFLRTKLDTEQKG